MAGPPLIAAYRSPWGEPTRSLTMRFPALVLALGMFVLVNVARADETPALANPAIDMPGFLRVAAEAAAHRDARRLTESEFLRLSREPGTMVLDARSREKYDELHVAGAVNLTF